MKIPYTAKIEQEDGTVAWGWAYIEEAEPEQTGPEIPYEVWNTRPIDAERCHAATQALCG
jgi:hypothetical protein